MILAWVALIPGQVWAQDESENNATSSTTNDSTGIVTSVSQWSIAVNSRRGPFTYALDPDLHIVGPDTKPLKIGDVQIGQEVTVYYYKHIGTETAARIVVLKEKSSSKK